MEDMDYEAEQICDDLLAEEMCCAADDAYDRWRDMWSDNLHSDLEKVYDAFVKPVKHGYYSGSPEKFLEHCVEILADITHCDIRANDGNIIAIARPKIVGDTNEVHNEVEQPIRSRS